MWWFTFAMLLHSKHCIPFTLNFNLYHSISYEFCVLTLLITFNQNHLSKAGRETHAVLIGGGGGGGDVDNSIIPQNFIRKMHMCEEY